MNHFHAFVRQVSLVWILIYVAVLAIALARPLAFFALSAFEFAPTYYYEVLNTLRTAALWLIPSGFLWLAFTLSRSNRKSYR